MPGAAAFYSVIQYCPDRFRLETVNIGIVLYCAEPRFLKARITDNHRRLRNLFGIAGADLEALKLAERNLLGRINANGETIASRDDLTAFIATRANDLRLTELRLVKATEDATLVLDRLYNTLVEDPSQMMAAMSAPAEVLPPTLGEVFYRLSAARKIWAPGRITVPVYKRKLDIPYAYRNGVVNLVKPHVFPATKRAESQAATLAINGDLIKNHPVDGEDRRLIVVSTQETPDQAREIRDHVEPLFAEYGVRLIRPAAAEAFAREVEQLAH